jgi:hypothetical protein
VCIGGVLKFAEHFVSPCNDISVATESSRAKSSVNSMTRSTEFGRVQLEFVELTFPRPQKNWNKPPLAVGCYSEAI